MTLKSSFRSFLTEQSRGELAADGLLFTAGAFAALAGIAFLIEWSIPGSLETEGPLAGFVIWILTVAGFVVGPVLAWRLHRRPLGKKGITSLVIGMFAGNSVMYVTAIVVALFSFLLGLILPGEFTGPIIMLAIVALGMTAVVLWSVVDAVRDLVAARDHPALDVWRLAALLAIIAFVVGSVLHQIAVPAEGIIEADVFMIAGGIAGGAALLAADLVAKLMNRRAPAQVAV
ncbi:MAG: hypothetical protein ACYC6C_00760 [Coriobacteriia bacterium]